MSTYLESFILFILCSALYPAKYLDACHISFVLLSFAIFCFETVAKSDKTVIRLGIVILILCFFIPEISVFLPFLCYIFFYRRLYLLPCLYLLPVFLYLCKDTDSVNFLIFPLSGLCFYFAWQNRKRNELEQMVKTLRDNSVEKEIILRKSNAQLLDSQNDQIYIATLKERNRIAREIHDSVGHMLSRSILQVGALLTVCKDETVKPHLESLNISLNEAMDSIRNSVHDLHDEAIDLKEALTALIDPFTFCPVRLEYEMSSSLPKEIKYCFLSITKEAFNNIMKHSNATKVCIIAKEHPGFYQFLIEDNGTGIPVLPEESSGMGLNNMKERVNAMHGIFHISTEHGFRIFISIPK